MSSLKSQLAQAAMQQVVAKVTKAAKDLGNSMKKPKRKKKRNRLRSNLTSTIDRPSLQYGYVNPGNRFTTGKPQAHSEYDNSNGVRLSGTSIISCYVGTGSLTATLGALQQGSAAVWYYPVTPSALDPRVIAYTKLFGFYAFRQLRVQYIPACSSSTAGTVAIGLVNDYSVTTDTTQPSQQQIMANEHCAIVPLWSVGEIKCTCRGSKLYNTLASGAVQLEDRIQYYIAAAFDRTQTGPVTYGALMVEYVLDLYLPVIPRTAVNLSTSKDEEDDHHDSTPAYITPPTTPLNKPSSRKK